MPKNIPVGSRFVASLPGDENLVTICVMLENERVQMINEVEAVEVDFSDLDPASIAEVHPPIKDEDL